MNPVLRFPPETAVLPRFLSRVPVLFALVLTCAICVNAVPAAEQDNLRSLVSGRARVLFPAGRDTLAREAAATTNSSIERILKRLGIPMEGNVTVRLTLSRDEFDGACGQPMPDWALAAALPDNQIVVNAAQSTPATLNDIHLSMLHEMVHLALSQAELGRPDPLPRWFHEGAATWLSGRLPMLPNRHAFEEAAMHGDLIPFSELAGSFPQDADQADLAYLQCEDFVGWIALRSPEGLKGIINRYRAGGDFDRAFTETVGLSPSKAEREWASSLKKSHPWLRTLFRSLTFWSVMALATVAVFVLVRLRARKQHREWEREEEIYSVLDLEEPPADEPEDDDPSDEWDPGEPIHG